MVKAAHRFFNDSRDRFEQFKRVERLYEKFTPESQTAFYREMERMEDEMEEVTSVRSKRRIGNRRFH